MSYPKIQHEWKGSPTHGYHTSDGKKIYTIFIYFEKFPCKVSWETGYIDYDKLEEKAMDFRPNIIIWGGNAYTKAWDYARFCSIVDQCGAMRYGSH